MEKKPYFSQILKGLVCLVGAGLVLFAVMYFALPFGAHPDEPSTQPTLPPPPANPYDAEDFYREGEYIFCNHAPLLVGVDVSDHQNEIDWQAVADAGVNYAMIRVGYRGYTEGGIFLDTRWQENVEGALDAGLQVGVYFYSQAVSVEEAQEEAQFVLDAIKDYAITYPVAFDWECVGEDARTFGASSQLVTDCTAAFCKAVEKAGYVPSFYFNQSMSQDTFQLRKLKDYDFWLAQYDEAMTFPYEVQMWQYSCTGHVPGIPADVDLNLSFRDYGAGK